MPSFSKSEELTTSINLGCKPPIKQLITDEIHAPVVQAQSAELLSHVVHGGTLEYGILDKTYNVARQMILHPQLLIKTHREFGTR
jgi:hypothetical protein